tara:strand:- start:708 stop:956 length:249 start_codon:yes stop_codon:yes gene_type:complete
MFLSTENFLEELKEILNNKEKNKKFSKFDIKKLFRIFNKENPRKLIFIFMQEELIVNFQTYVNGNIQLIKTNFIDFHIQNNL